LHRRFKGSKHYFDKEDIFESWSLEAKRYFGKDGMRKRLPKEAVMRNRMMKLIAIGAAAAWIIAGCVQTDSK